VGADESEVARFRVARDYVAQELAHYARRFSVGRARAWHFDGIVAEVGKIEVFEEQPAVGVRIGAHAAGSRRRELGELGQETSLLVEKLLRPVAAHPLLKQLDTPGLGHVG